MMGWFWDHFRTAFTVESESQRSRGSCEDDGWKGSWRSSTRAAAEDHLEHKFRVHEQYDRRFGDDRRR